MSDSPDPDAPDGHRTGNVWWLLGAVALAVGVVGAIFLTRPRHDAALPLAGRDCGEARTIVPVGSAVPLGCKVVLLSDGSTSTLGQVAAGKPTVVNFWASWCGACIQEMPELQKVSLAAAGSVQFVGMDLLGVDGETRADALAFSHQRAVTYPLAYDDGGLLYGRISLRVLPPTTAFVRADGTLAGISLGQLTAGDLRADISRYLGIRVAP